MSRGNNVAFVSFNSLAGRFVSCVLVCENKSKQFAQSVRQTSFLSVHPVQFRFHFLQQILMRTLLKFLPAPLKRSQIICPRRCFCFCLSFSFCCCFATIVSHLMNVASFKVNLTPADLECRKRGRRVQFSLLFYRKRMLMMMMMMISFRRLLLLSKSSNLAHLVHLEGSGFSVGRFSAIQLSKAGKQASERERG